MIDGAARAWLGRGVAAEHPHPPTGSVRRPRLVVLDGDRRRAERRVTAPRRPALVHVISTRPDAVTLAPVFAAIERRGISAGRQRLEVVLAAQVAEQHESLLDVRREHGRHAHAGHPRLKSSGIIQNAGQ